MLTYLLEDGQIWIKQQKKYALKSEIVEFFGTEILTLCNNALPFRYQYLCFLPQGQT